MDIDKLNMDIMNIPLTEESRYGSLAEWKAYREGHRDARHAAVEMVLEHNKASGSELAPDERALPARWQDRSWAHASPEELDPEDHTPQLLAEIADWRAWGAQQAVAPAEPIGEVMAKPDNERGTLTWPRVVWKDGLFALPPVGTKLYASPSPSEKDDQDAKDAACMDYIAANAVRDATYQGITSLNVIVHADDLRIGGPRYAIECMQERDAMSQAKQGDAS